jgi:UrcA family protein
LPHSRQEILTPAEALNDLPDNQETIMKTFLTSSNLPRRITTAIFVALALSCGAVSIAADASDVPQVLVKFGDLNLSNPQGATTLYSRIAAAANTVCKAFDINGRDLGSRARLDACVHTAIANAVTNVDHPELFAVYKAKNHQPRPIIVAAVQTR